MAICSSRKQSAMTDSRLFVIPHRDFSPEPHNALIEEMI